MKVDERRMTEGRTARSARPATAAALAALLTAGLAFAACGGPEATEGPRDAPATAEAEQDARQATGDPDARQAPDAPDLVPIRVGGVAIRVAVADDPETRERGLMFRDSLPDDEGMLFVYPTERTLTFWMVNTPLALDIAFADRRGRIVDIQQMEPFDEETTRSRRPAMYALEMRQGWFEDHGVGVGDRIEF